MIRNIYNPSMLFNSKNITIMFATIDYDEMQFTNVSFTTLDNALKFLNRRMFNNKVITIHKEQIMDMELEILGFVAIDTFTIAYNGRIFKDHKNRKLTDIVPYRRLGSYE